ncbi:concanavalin A-like lectin/glucanase domain-containing protein [Cercophora newfieldiana]|uniref:Concanavalin A-like lectin/glucanase domain-containing protein n=1 Tax=Cercophora newfieldiana TaxID=92897 RepID=A0AA39YFI5_9PEZI|nr:concanavalin A-like lectin/glucanase domain-containing protein [Cercophora newfieldiana]
MRPTLPLLALLPLASASPARRQASSPSIQAGGILSLPGDTITSVSGTFRVPHLSIPVSGPYASRKGIYAFSIWIGIGGSPAFGVTTSCAGDNPGILRAGIDVFYNGFDDKPMVPYAWYEGGPRSDLGAFGYAGFNVDSGDLVKITVTADGNSVDAVIENFGRDVTTTAGKTPVQRDKPTYGLNERVGSSLCRSEAAWVVEDHMTETTPSLPVVLGNFTAVEFGELSVKSRSGGSVGSAKVVDILLPDQGGRLTKCEAVGTNGLSCKRVVEEVSRAVPRADGSICEE